MRDTQSQVRQAAMGFLFLAARSTIDRTLWWAMRAIHDVLLIALERSDHDMLVETVTIAGRIAVVARERCDDPRMARAIVGYARDVGRIVGYPASQLP